MTDITESAAYKRGVARAIADAALAPPPTRFMSVHTPQGSWSMCRACTYPAERCRCAEET